MRFQQGERVAVRFTDQKSKRGEVAYQRMAPPDYREAAAVSVVLDERRGQLGYTGTIFSAEQVGRERERRGGPQARFWVFHREGWVRIKLELGQQVTIWEGGEHEEGYSSSQTQWVFESDEAGVLTVEQHYASSGRDCDGPHFSYYSCECLFEDLAAEPADRMCYSCFPHEVEDGTCARKGHTHEERPARPGWKRIESGQRDYFAEAMNY